MYELLTASARLYVAAAMDYDGPPRTPLVTATLRDCLIYFGNTPGDERASLEVLLGSGEWLVAPQLATLLRYLSE